MVRETRSAACGCCQGHRHPSSVCSWSVSSRCHGHRHPGSSLSWLVAADARPDRLDEARVDVRAAWVAGCHGQCQPSPADVRALCRLPSGSLSWLPSPFTLVRPSSTPIWTLWWPRPSHPASTCAADVLAAVPAAWQGVLLVLALATCSGRDHRQDKSDVGAFTVKNR